MHYQTEETCAESTLTPSTMTTTLSPAMLCKVQAVAKILSQTTEVSQVPGGPTRKIQFVSLQQIAGEADMETSTSGYDVPMKDGRLACLGEEEQEETTIGLGKLQRVGMQGITFSWTVNLVPPILSSQGPYWSCYRSKNYSAQQLVWKCRVHTTLQQIETVFTSVCSLIIWHEGM